MNCIVNALNHPGGLPSLNIVFVFLKYTLFIAPLLFVRHVFEERYGSNSE